jgi:translation initiation factor IF-2
MRARGAQVTDVVVLVVAADDGVMAQTEEAIAHARAADVPIVVALNKVDKPDANPLRAMQQLAGQDLNVEEWGGEVGCVQVSAINGEGIEELLERTMLEAELLELESDYERRADGAVLEARVEEGLGVVANCIVRNGTLSQGDFVVCGPAYGRVRSLGGQRGEELEQAPPSAPVAISGLNRVPEAGDPFVVVDDQDVARDAAEKRFEQIQEERRRPRSHVTLENLYESLAAGEEEQLRVVVKGDVKGSLEPLVQSLEEISTDEASVRILHRGVGPVNVSDVLLADASDAVVLAFRVGIEERAREEANEAGVDVRYFRVIYEAIQAIRDALEGMLAPEQREERLGVAEIRQIFKISRIGNIAGCYVRDGTIRRSDPIRVVRDGKVVHEGEIDSLKREKNDVREVESGFECGIKIAGYDDIRVGDLIECYTVREVKRVLS